MADGPIQLKTSLTDNDIQLEHITRFGRSFSIVSIPYTMKLLIQELQTINVQMRIITDDNIKQLENMSYSHNLDKIVLTDKDKGKPAANPLLIDNHILPKDIVSIIQEKLKSQEPYERTPTSIADQPNSYQQSNPYQQQIGSVDSDEWEITDRSPISPPYIPGSPAYNSESPPYIPGSPAYISESPPYIPGSPAYNPGSPAYVPMSPSNYDFTYNSSQKPSFYNPYSPSISPPDDLSNLESLPFQSTNYNINDVVFLHGDTIPNRKWIISKLGDKFITIKTDDDRQLEPGETVKIVTSVEIYRPEDVVYEQNPQPNIIRGGQSYPSQYSNGNDGSNISGGSGGGGSGGITFAPVIQIGGSDNIVNPAMGGISTGGLSNIIDKPTNDTIQTVGSGETDPKATGIDFGKLQIKKVG
jgi:hypothetical protein